MAFCFDRRPRASRKNRLTTKVVIPTQAMAMCARQGGSHGRLMVPDLVSASCRRRAVYSPQPPPTLATTIAVGVGSAFHCASERSARTVLCAIGRPCACLTCCRFSTSRGGKGHLRERGSALTGLASRALPPYTLICWLQQGAAPQLFLCTIRFAAHCLFGRFISSARTAGCSSRWRTYPDLTVEFRKDLPCRLLTFGVQRC